MKSSREQETVVRKHNDLIEAKYKLTLNEQRLILVLASKINMDDEDFEDYQIRIDDLSELFNLEKGKNTYKIIHECARGLVGKRLEFFDEDYTTVTTWLSYARYKPGKGFLEVRFDKSIKPYLLQLKSHFTQYQLGAVAQFKSSYSIRFYELLKAKEFQGKGGQFYRTFSVDNIRDYMQLGDKEYSVFQDLKKRIIAPAMQEINEHSDLSIAQVEYLKKGRVVSEVKITVDPKQKIIVDAGEETYDEAQSALMALGIAEDTSKKWVHKFGSARVLRNIAYTLTMQQEGHVKSPIAYLATCMDADAGKGWEEEKRKREEVKQALQSEQEAVRRKEQEDLLNKKKSKEEISSTLEQFWALSETTQEAMRDMFYSGLSSPLKAVWKKSESRPEEKPMFALQFIALLKENSVI